MSLTQSGPKTLKVTRWIGPPRAQDTPSPAEILALTRSCKRFQCIPDDILVVFKVCSSLHVLFKRLIFRLLARTFIIFRP